MSGTLGKIHTVTMLHLAALVPVQELQVRMPGSPGELYDK